MNSRDLPTLAACVDKLFNRLFAKQEELRKREQSCGMAHDIRKMNRLREEIRSLERRLTLAEKLQDEALRNPA